MKRKTTSRPYLAYRKRRSFDAWTDEIISDVALMQENARDDAQALLQALPDMAKLDGLEGTDAERCAFAYLFFRALETFREKANPFSMIEVMEIIHRDTNSARALLKHAPHRAARVWVEEEWTAHREAYDGNKSAFARDYSARLRNERGVKVTDKQIRDVWLQTTGLRANRQVCQQTGSDAEES